MLFGDHVVQPDTVPCPLCDLPSFIEVVWERMVSIQGDGGVGGGGYKS